MYVELCNIMYFSLGIAWILVEYFKNFRHANSLYQVFTLVKFSHKIVKLQTLILYYVLLGYLHMKKFCP